MGTAKRVPVAATLAGTRKTSFGIELRSGVSEIMVDGKSVAAIEHSETVEAASTLVCQVLKIRSGRYSSLDRSFDAAGWRVTRFRCHGAMVWPRWVASLVEPDPAIALIRK
jgi:hypothetical protein